MLQNYFVWEIGSVPWTYWQRTCLELNYLICVWAKAVAFRRLLTITNILLYTITCGYPILYTYLSFLALIFGFHTGRRWRVLWILEGQQNIMKHRKNITITLIRERNVDTTVFQKGVIDTILQNNVTSGGRGKRGQGTAGGAVLAFMWWPAKAATLSWRYPGQPVITALNVVKLLPLSRNDKVNSNFPDTPVFIIHIFHSNSGPW